MATLDEILSILNNSLTGAELPTISGPAQATDYRIVYVVANQRFEKQKLTDAGSNPNLLAVNVGTAPTAGVNTTDTEIINRINTVGFTISVNQLVIVELNIYRGGSLVKRRYIKTNNTVGTYGNAGTALVLSDFYRLGDEYLNPTNENATIIQLGDIGSSTIEDYINATTPPVDGSWELASGVLYMFKCVIDSVSLSYLWIGAQPLNIGNGQNAVTSNDFYLLGDDGWQWIENCWVQKASGNDDYNLIEVNDIVFFRQVVYSGQNIFINGYTYDGGDKSLFESFTKVINFG